MRLKIRAHKTATLLLDFDGTLSPIVRRPHLAKISPTLKKKVSQLAKHPRWTVGVVSGRDLSTVKKKMGLSKLIYAGNHGYELLFPGKKKMVHPAAKKAKKIISALCQELRQKLKTIPGAMVENKIYSASIHTRTLNKENEKKTHQIFRIVLRKPIQKRQVRVTEGKKVLEIRPPAKWDKGKAVLFILKKVKKPGLPIYIGDDKTDEDAFRVLKKRGLSIRVGRKTRTLAHHTIPSVKHMPRLLNSFTLPAK